MAHGLLRPFGLFQPYRLVLRLQWKRPLYPARKGDSYFPNGPARGNKRSPIKPKARELSGPAVSIIKITQAAEDATEPVAASPDTEGRLVISSTNSPKGYLFGDSIHNKNIFSVIYFTERISFQ
ncbi:MAG: hypothetical protein EBS07_00690 [Sphingobacteriia bacterium]|nr:hypothetical protein [Sphingobacteriia bacterium]